MAAVVSVNEVKVLIEKTVEKELYISKSEKLVTLHEFLKNSLLEKVIERCIDIYDKKRQNCSASGVFTFTFYKYCDLANDGIVDNILPELVEFINRYDSGYFA